MGAVEERHKKRSDNLSLLFLQGCLAYLGEMLAESSRKTGLLASS